MNWSSEVFACILSSIISGISLYIVFSEYKAHKSTFLKYILLSNLCLFLFTVTGVFQYLLLSKLIFKIQTIIVIPSGLMIIISTDYLKRYTIEPIKIFIYGLTIGGLLYVLFFCDCIEETVLNSGEPTLKASIQLQIWGSILMVEILVLFFYNTILIYKNADREIKSKARLTVFGGSLYLFLTFFTYLFGLTKVIPGIIGFSMSVGTIIIAISFKLEPRIVTVLIKSHHKAKIKLVKKIIPICSHCKSFRNEEGVWYPIEEFLHDSSNVFLSHSICPSCLTTHYSDVDL